MLRTDVEAEKDAMPLPMRALRLGSDLSKTELAHFLGFPEKLLTDDDTGCCTSNLLSQAVRRILIVLNALERDVSARSIAGSETKTSAEGIESC